MPHRPASDALKQVTVLDLTRVRSGPTCVRQLADWGADVIKIETPEALADDGAVGAARASADYQNLNRNKRSLTLNLKEEEGRALFLRLVERADVVVENFRPAVKDRLGIGYEALRAVNPRIVLGSISGFGQDGPDADRPGFDQIAQGMAGLMSITGEPGRGPMRAGIPIADLTAGLFCALGIFVALYERERSGEGQWVTTSLIEAQAFMLDFQAARYLIGGEVPGQAGNDHPTSMPTSVYPTADGHINIGVSGQRIWRRFCAAIDRDDWFADPRFETGRKRSENRKALNALIADVTRTDTGDRWIALFNEAGVPAGRINDIGEMFDEPQFAHLEIAQPVETRPFGETRMVRQPMRLSRTPSRIASPAPEPGEHAGEILASIGIGDDEIARLRERGVI